MLQAQIPIITGLLIFTLLLILSEESTAQGASSTVPAEDDYGWQIGLGNALGLGAAVLGLALDPGALAQEEPRFSAGLGLFTAGIVLYQWGPPVLHALHDNAEVFGWSLWASVWPVLVGTAVTILPGALLLASGYEVAGPVVIGAGALGGATWGTYINAVEYVEEGRRRRAEAPLGVVWRASF